MSAQLEVQDDPARVVAELLAPTTPNDTEVVGVLRRLAAAQAHLLAAEQRAADAVLGAEAGPRRLHALEEARSAVLWARADLIVRDGGRQRRALAEAEAALAAELDRQGFDDFDAYLRTRGAPVVPAADPHLQLARREHADARRAWEDLVAEFGDRTVVLDLTGAEPRRLA